ncbi:MAG: hypothetical protein K0U52_09295 [Gammaproteobacteria bacterium]|nr:hypothetical protein [Gammaproteobacteria bacterium]
MSILRAHTKLQGDMHYSWCSDNECEYVSEDEIQEFDLSDIPADHIPEDSAPLEWKRFIETIANCDYGCSYEFLDGFPVVSYGSSYCQPSGDPRAQTACGGRRLVTWRIEDEHYQQRNGDRVRYYRR